MIDRNLSMAFAQNPLAARDTNNDGFLDKSEVGMDQVPDDQWAVIMNMIDRNKDGKISLGEYEEYSNKQQATQGDNQAQIEMGLKALDLNHDGNLDRSEIGMDQLSDDQWARIMNLTDTNLDGNISFKEYQEYSSKRQATQGDELEGSQVE